MKKVVLFLTLAAWGIHAADAQNLPFLGMVSPGQVQNVTSQGGLTNTSRFMLKNTGTVPLQFYMAATSTAKSVGTGVTVPANSQTEATVAQLGGTLVGKFLNVANNAAAGFGKLGIFNVLKTFPQGPTTLSTPCLNVPQWQSDFPNNYLFNCSSSVGIGTNTPMAPFHVVGYTRMDGGLALNGTEVISNGLFVGSGLTGPLYGTLFVNGPGRFGTDQNNIYIGTGADGSTNTSIESFGGNGLLINYYNGLNISMFGNVHLAAHLGSTVAPNLVVDGNVGIGTSLTSPSLTNYKLSVNGTIHAREILLEEYSWPDYVFAKKYTLMPLNTLEKYINDNHRLPKMPTANDVEQKGVPVAEMVHLQMQKIEELTLYMIEQNKQLEALKKENAQLAQQVKAIAEKK